MKKKVQKKRFLPKTWHLNFILAIACFIASIYIPSLVSGSTIEIYFAFLIVLFLAFCFKVVNNKRIVKLMENLRNEIN